MQSEQTESVRGWARTSSERPWYGIALLSTSCAERNHAQGIRFSMPAAPLGEKVVLEVKSA
jgi:hypothetical protein